MLRHLDSYTRILLWITSRNIQILNLETFVIDFAIKSNYASEFWKCKNISL